METAFVFELDGAEPKRELFFKRLELFARERGWDLAVTNEIHLLLEEWITNVLTHGAAAGETLAVRVAISEKAFGCARIEVQDNGIPFDPTLCKDPDLTAPADQRPIGGLGIYMIKKLSTRLRYERREQLNVLVIEKNLFAPALAKAKRN
jgi:anti-sigma regulatory factor (Ser/Thr protein kinase)